MPNLSSRKFKSSGDGLVCITQDNIANQTEDFWDSVTILRAKTKASVKKKNHQKKALKREFQCRDLTLHCCACWLCKERNKQEIDEVDEGQGIVPEQASCRNKDTKYKQEGFDHNT